MIPIYTVDAFTSSPFSGNPAAVCVVQEFPPDDKWLRKVAAEMNLSETAFLCPMDQVGNYRLRWFTPAGEVDLCGHATLASAQVLWESGVAYRIEQLRFHTRSGLLTAKRVDGGIELNFPAEPVSPCEAPPQLAEAIGFEPRAVYKNRMDYLIELPSEQAVREFRPDFRALKELPGRGLIVTSPADDPEVDFVSRCFFPALGIDEDPVTGSAHCALAPYWKEKLGKTQFKARQLSSRTGELKLRLSGERVLIQGQAVIIVKGLLLH
ncbi:PhzF family phenazine biosynthesis protein [Paenibacillus doosanensis]|uniref:Isomerase YddE n=1 Tax=Paenibacillus konkukensis TaxID=2020716 RepID=A0ABY4RPU8_9BACL|nr:MULTISPECIES: PhzF family phenazine biosynthesis protein [Paenibacillus]MCS7463396.1 PhzF family phenazine biosynthesis protein [Paenibacillus doosanensis]UQZ84005.1 putative isomerase YddE [Paenibacillus konkukensis]